MNHKLLVSTILCASFLFVTLSPMPSFAQPETNKPDTIKFPVTPLDGKPAPSFSLPRYGDNKIISLDSLKGQLVILNFWASWCGPCRDEMPLLNRVHDQYAGQELILLGVNYQQSEKAIRRYLELRPITFPTLIDETGSLASDYHLTGLPATFFIDREGIVVGGVLGGLNAQILSAWMDRLIQR